MDNANFYRDGSREYPVIERNDGIYVQDDQGRTFIDFGSGIGVTHIGGSVREVVDRMKAQLDKATFVYNGVFTNGPSQNLAGKLLALAPPNMGGVIFASSGSEANEVAIKIARQYHVETGADSRYKVVARGQSYHGNTLMSLSVSDRPSWSGPFGPYLQNVPRISAPYCYRCPLKMEYPSCEVRCARELDELIEHEGPEAVSAFIAEPIMGTTVAGVVPPVEYYKIIRETCDRYGVLFIADEVITGMGRTGRNFGIDHWGVAPDIIVVAKGLAAGYAPLSAVLVSKKIVAAIREGSGNHMQGFTYSGNPLSCTAGLAVLEYVEEHDLIRLAAVRGEHLGRHLEALKGIPIVGDVRGRGMFHGIEFVRDRETKSPFPVETRLTQRIVDRAAELGLIVIAAMPGCADGVNGDQLQISPALVFSENDIDQAMAVLRRAIESVAAEVMS